MRSLNVLGAGTWALCPGAAGYQEAEIAVPEGDQLMTLEWAGHPEISYHGPRPALQQGALTLRSGSFLQPEEDFVLLCQLFGALWDYSAETVGAVRLVTMAGNTQLNLRILPDIRDELVARIEAALAEDPEFRPGPQCQTCAGQMVCSATNPTVVPGLEFMA